MNNKTYQPVQFVSIEVKQDTEAFRFIDFSGNLCADNERALGVNEVKGESGQYLAVATLGTIVVQAAGNISIGDDVTSAADGKARVAVTNEKVNARALESVSVGEYLRCKLVV